MCSKRFLSVALLSFAGCTFNAPVDVDIHDPNILLNAEGTIGPPQVDVHIETIGGPPGLSIPVVEDDSIVLVAGIHVGTIEITENNVFLAGEVDEDGNLLTTIDGDLIIRGNNVTVRGLIVTGAVIIRGNNAILGFSEMFTAEVRGNNAILHDNVLSAPPQVTGNNIVLEDNVFG